MKRKNQLTEFLSHGDLFAQGPQLNLRGIARQGTITGFACSFLVLVVLMYRFLHLYVDYI